MSLEQTRLIYILYFIGAFIWPVLLAGVILAYVEKEKAVDLILQSHLKKQIKIFWIHLLIAIGGAIVMISLLPIVVTLILSSFYCLVLVAYVWIASFKGLSRLDAGAPID